MTAASLCGVLAAPEPLSVILPPGMLDPPPEIESVKSNLNVDALPDFVAACSIGDVPVREPSATPVVAPAATTATASTAAIEILSLGMRMISTSSPVAAISSS